MRVIRQVVLTATDGNGATHTLRREFKGLRAVMLSYFATMQNLVDAVPNNFDELYVTSKFSYFVVKKENQ